MCYNKDDGKGAALRLPGKGGAGMAIRSEAQKKAVAKYNAANYDRVELRVEKGKKETIKAFAESRGESLNGFINRAIDETMQRDEKGTWGRAGLCPHINKIFQSTAHIIQMQYFLLVILDNNKKIV